MEKSYELYIQSRYKYISKTEGISKEDLAKQKIMQKEMKKKMMQESCKAKAPVARIKNVIKYEDKTKPGDKKDLSGPMPESYDPSYVESSWDAWWKKENFFKVSAEDAQKQPDDFDSGQAGKMPGPVYGTVLRAERRRSDLSLQERVPVQDYG